MRGPPFASRSATACRDRDEGATTPPTWPVAPVEPVELDERHVDGEDACLNGGKPAITSSLTPLLEARFSGAPTRGFKFEYRIPGTSPSTVVLTADAYLTPQVEPAHTYEWRVRAVGATGWSEWCAFAVRPMTVD
ncbi:hypothetical protein AB0M02_33400 [Actinoplanes sp. NPDC051861]|uniref:hypothetical protein n=1 Tax=Actinoplanes sp. NPDC051861 TaxID=3155170 RepID=UPI00341F6B99